MAKLLQSLLLQVYRVAVRSGALDLPGMRTVFETCYGLYKQFVEARYVALLRPHVAPGTIVVDVGANVGFFTRYFADWTGSNGRVLAIEPEQRNFDRLQSMIRSRRLNTVVEAVHAAAAERAGQVALTIDPFHPAGHSLSAEGVPTRAVAIDDLVRHHEDRTVSLIKIDVQGAELRVLKGAASTLRTFRPALVVELDEKALRSQGASVEAVVEFLASFGYRGQLLSSEGLSSFPDRRELIVASLAHEYIDALFIGGPEPSSLQPVGAGVSSAS
jgi:FkbM family methyltransferase